VKFLYGSLKLTNVHLHGEDILNMDCGCIDLCACILVCIQ